MGNAGAVKYRVLSVLLESFYLCLGLAFSILLLSFTVLSTPVFIIRYFITLLAKLARPELGNILGGLTAGLASDFFSEKPPRCNVVVGLVAQGTVTLDEIKERVQKYWISGQTNLSTPYHKFQQHPVRWLGFTFWKKADKTFDIRNHVNVLTDHSTLITEDNIDEIIEKLVNTRLPQNRSPWQLFLIENYQPKYNSTGKPHVVLFMQFHHCLSDGIGILIAACTAFCDDFSIDKLELPNMQFPKRTPWQNFRFWLTFPVNLLREGAQLFSQAFRKSPLMVSDSEKKWCQMYAKSEPVPIELVKNIKNAQGVSFTSVLLSAISEAVCKHLSKMGKLDKQNYWRVRTMPCGTVMPVPGSGRPDGLVNYVTGAGIDISLKTYKNPLQRLQDTHEMLKGKRDTVLPYLLYYSTVLAGSHFYPVTKALFYNRLTGTALTNFASSARKLGTDSADCTQIFGAAGGLDGDCGVVWAVVTHNQEIRFQVVVEKGVMTRTQTNALVDYVTEEIHYMHKLVQKEELGKSYSTLSRHGAKTRNLT